MNLPNPELSTDTMLEQLILSAKKTGYAEAMNEVTKLLVVVACMDNKDVILKALARGVDEIHKKGFSLHA